MRVGSLSALKPGADFSFFVMYVQSGIFFHRRPVSSILKICRGLYPPPPSSMMRLSSSGYEGIAGLEIVEPACAGNKIGYGARLLHLQVVVALHGLLIGVVEGHVEALMLTMIHPCDQHLLKTDHEGGLTRRHPGEITSCPCFKDCRDLFLVLPDGT